MLHDSRWCLAPRRSTGCCDWSAISIFAEGNCLIKSLIKRISISCATHRYGVNGGGNFPAVSGWRRRMQDWLIQKASTQQQMRTSPMGPT